MASFQDVDRCAGRTPRNFEIGSNGIRLRLTKYPRPLERAGLAQVVAPEDFQLVAVLGALEPESEQRVFGDGGAGIHYHDHLAVEFDIHLLDEMRRDFRERVASSSTGRSKRVMRFDVTGQKLLELRGRQWPAEIEALHDIAAAGVQVHQLLFEFNTLRNNIQSQRVRHLDDGRGNGRALLALRG